MAGTVQTASAADNAAVSVPSSPQGWYFSHMHTGEDGLGIPTTGSGSWVEDEIGGRPGPGSFELEIDNDPAAEKARLETQQFNHLTLGDLVSFGYATHKTGMTGYAPAINVMIDPSGSDDFNGTDDFATLVWEANKAGHIVIDGVWQDWATAKGDGWWTPTIQPFGSTTAGSNANPTSLATLINYFGAESEILSVAVNVGRHGPMTAHVDGVGVTSVSGTSTFDFEIDKTPLTKDECKDSGWQQFNAPTFTNQGDCVSFLQSARK